MIRNKLSTMDMPYLAVFLIIYLFAACNTGQPDGSEDATADGPAIHGQEIRYTVGQEEHVGYIARDTTIHGKRPGVLVVHEWWGHNAYARKRADMLAEMGYTALALDMFGQGKTADHPDSAMAFVQEAIDHADRSRAKFEEALNLLKSHPSVDADQVAAIGYCFGGAVVLEMARAGVDLDGVVSFHGSLGTANPADNTMDAKVLAFTGGADPMIPAESVETFHAEMQAAGVDYQVVVYPDAKHSFTNPSADSLGQKFGLPLAYNHSADTLSWKATEAFFADLFQ